MLFSKKGMILLFISAYIPLFLVLSIKIISSEEITLYFILILTLISCFTIKKIDRAFKRIERLNKSFSTEIKVEQEKNEDYIFFIMTYLVPFFGIDMNLNTILAMLVLFLIIGYIYIHSSLFTVNPTLKLIWQYNLYQGVINDKKVIILSKKKLNNGSNRANLVKLSEDVFLV